MVVKWLDGPGNNDTLDKPKNKENDNNKELDKKFEKPDDVSYGVGLMAKKEIASAQEEINKLNLSPEELADKNYTGKFTIEQNKFTEKTKEILKNSPWKPEEKIKALELAYKDFQTNIWVIKGQKEWMDSERLIKQWNNIQEQDNKDKEWSKKFKDDLLKNIQEATATKARERAQRAASVSSLELIFAQVEAESQQLPTGDVTLAYWPEWVDTKWKNPTASA